MSKSNAYETALLQLVFQNSTIANIGDATGLRGSTTAGQLFFSLHSADPGEVGTQATNEVSYTGYARVGVARSGAGFTVTDSSVSPAANVDFRLARLALRPQHTSRLGLRLRGQPWFYTRGRSARTSLFLRA